MANHRGNVRELEARDREMAAAAARGEQYFNYVKGEPAQTGAVTTYAQWAESQRLRELNDRVQHAETLVCRWRVDAWLNGRVRSFAPKLPMTRAEIEQLVVNLFGPVSFVASPVPFTSGEARCLSEEVG